MDWPRPPQINEEQDRCVSGRCSCHTEDIRQLFICLLPSFTSLSLYTCPHSKCRLFSLIPVSISSNLCFSVSLLPSSPPQLLDDIYVFFGGQISRCFVLHRAIGFRLTAPVTCHSHDPTCSLLANQSRSSRKSLQLTSLPQTHLLLSQTSPLYSLECSKYEIGWQSHVFHCFTAIHYSLSASPPVIAVIKWKPRRLWRLECGEERRRIILG